MPPAEARSQESPSSKSLVVLAQLRIGGLIDLAHAPSPMRAVTS